MVLGITPSTKFVYSLSGNNYFLLHFFTDTCIIIKNWYVPIICK